MSRSEDVEMNRSTGSTTSDVQQDVTVESSIRPPSSGSINQRHSNHVVSSLEDVSPEDVRPKDSVISNPKLTPPSTPKIQVDVGQALEIDRNNDEDLDDLMAMDDDDNDDVDADLERLLGDVRSETDVAIANSRTATHAQGPFSSCLCCRGLTRTGNTLVIFPKIYAKTKWGMVGPHYFGPICVLMILFAASRHFIGEALRIGPVSTCVCVAFTFLTTFNLFSVSFRDPGIVTTRSHPPETITNLSRWRWCDLCNVYQPPDGQHCPDCNVCIEGYDHHCVWMGTCIGKGNMRQFIRFNLSWLFYLAYAIAWVTILGPQMYHQKNS